MADNTQIIVSNGVTNPKSFRYGVLPPILSLESPDDLTIIDDLKNAFQDTFFQETDDSNPPTKASNFAIAIPRKMWQELSHIFFNENDYAQNDGVLINLGFNIESRNIELLFQSFATIKDENGDDFGINENEDKMLMIEERSKSGMYRTGRGSGAGDDGGVTTCQIPPK
jgi:hypothetical protein